MTAIDDWMTPDELSRELWGKFPKHQYEANAAWLKEVFRVLKVGGIWAWKETNRVFKKASDTHFVELE